MLLSAAVITAPAVADSIDRNHRGTVRAGEMEHIEVIGKNYAPDATADKGQQDRGLRQILKQNLLEQVQSLELLQQRQLQRSRARNREALATGQERRRETSQDAARAEALRRERERVDELHRREEERLRTEAKAREQREPS